MLFVCNSGCARAEDFVEFSGLCGAQEAFDLIDGVVVGVVAGVCSGEDKFIFGIFRWRSRSLKSSVLESPAYYFFWVIAVQ